MNMIARLMPMSPTRLTTKAFLAAVAARRLVLPEADQQVGREAHALPADEQHEVVVGQHQQQHRGDEEVEVAEEPAPALVVGHVADGVDVDQPADAGDQQHEDDRELVDQQPDADAPAAAAEPLVQRHARPSATPRRGRAAATNSSSPTANETNGARVPSRCPQRVAGPADQQQHGGAGGRDGDHQPGPGEQPGRGDGRDDFQCDASTSPRTSAGWRRRPRPSGGCGRS